MRLHSVLFSLCCALGWATSPLTAQQPAPKHLRGTVDLTIGGADESRDAYIFEDVRGLTFDAQGRIFVAENKANEVRVFSPKGVLIYKIGQKGEGPGDLNQPCCIALSPKGQLWIKEFGNHRYSIFTPGPSKATFKWTLTMPRSFSYGGSDRITWDGRGHLVDINGRPFLEGKPTGIYRSLLDSLGKVVKLDSFAEAPADSVRTAVHFSTGPNGGRGSSGVTQPNGPFKLWAWGPDGEMTQAMSSRYAVSWTELSGKRVALLQRDVVGPPLSEKERKSATDVIASIEKRWGEKLPFGVPDRKSPLADVGFDLEGRLWVELAVPEGAPHQADLYDRSHRLVATMEWPANVSLRLRAVRGNVAVGTARDADGDLSVVRLRFGP